MARGTVSGKVVVGSSSTKQRLLVIVQADGDRGRVDLETIRTMFTMQAIDNAGFMDCSDSATLWFDSKFQVLPSAHKDAYLEVAVGFK